MQIIWSGDTLFIQVDLLPVEFLSMLQPWETDSGCTDYFELYKHELKPWAQQYKVICPKQNTLQHICQGSHWT